MTYKTALTLGQRADGVIKCTYAELYDENGLKLFSFQRLVGKGTYTVVDELSNGVTVDKDKIVMSVDFPLVEVSGEPMDTRLVPCKLLYGAREILFQAIQKARRKNEKYRVMLEMLNNNKYFYIKPAAFFWSVSEFRLVPEIDPETGETINYTSERLAKAEENLKMARAILLGSTATLIL